MLIIGHRGASGHAPENTVAAFNLAFEHGADGIECDLIQNGDDFYAIHDLRLERTTNGCGYVTAHSKQALSALDAGDGQTIPLLADVLQCIPTNGVCNLEIKHLDSVTYFANLLQAQLAKCTVHISQILVSSFHHGWLDELQTIWPELPVAYLIAHYPVDVKRYFATLNSTKINVALDIVDSQLVQIAHSLNKQVWVYTVDAEQDMQRCRDMGVDGIFTNYPKRAKCLLLGL